MLARSRSRRRARWRCSPATSKKLMSEAKAAGQRSRELRLAAVKAGQSPRYCPPEGKQSMSSTEFMNRLGAIPAAERARIDMTEAMTRILIQKFPCPKG